MSTSVDNSSDDTSETVCAENSWIIIWLTFRNLTKLHELWMCYIKIQSTFNKSLNTFSLKMCCNPNIMFQFQLQYTNFQNYFFHTESKVKFHLLFIHYSFLLRCLCVLRNSEMWNKSLPVEWDHSEPTGKVLLLFHEMQQTETLFGPSLSHLLLWTYLGCDFPSVLGTSSQDWVRYQTVVILLSMCSHHLFCALLVVIVHRKSPQNIRTQKSTQIPSPAEQILTQVSMPAAYLESCWKESDTNQHLLLWDCTLNYTRACAGTPLLHRMQHYCIDTGGYDVFRPHFSPELFLLLKTNVWSFKKGKLFQKGVLRPQLLYNPMLVHYQSTESHTTSCLFSVS